MDEKYKKFQGGFYHDVKSDISVTKKMGGKTKKSSAPVSVNSEKVSIRSGKSKGD